MGLLETPLPWHATIYTIATCELRMPPSRSQNVAGEQALSYPDQHYKREKGVNYYIIIKGTTIIHIGGGLLQNEKKNRSSASIKKKNNKQRVSEKKNSFAKICTTPPHPDD